MSRSYHKSNNMQHAFIGWVCYFSNKKDKRICNRILRRVSRHKLKLSIINNDLDNYLGYIKTREVRNVYDFASDGLKQFFNFKHDSKYRNWSKEDIKKEIRK